MGKKELGTIFTNQLKILKRHPKIEKHPFCSVENTVLIGQYWLTFISQLLAPPAFSFLFALSWISIFYTASKSISHNPLHKPAAQLPQGKNCKHPLTLLSNFSFTCRVTQQQQNTTTGPFCLDLRGHSQPLGHFFSLPLFFVCSSD